MAELDSLGAWKELANLFRNIPMEIWNLIFESKRPLWARMFYQAYPGSSGCVHRLICGIHLYPEESKLYYLLGWYMAVTNRERFSTEDLKVLVEYGLEEKVNLLSDAFL